MGTEGLASLIEIQHEPHLHCHVLIDPLAIAGNGDHALLAQLRSALGEHALTYVPRADLAHAHHLHPVLVCLAMPGTTPSRSLLEQTARAAQKGLYQRRRYLCGWLFSEAPSATLASHLAALCRVPDAQGAFSFYPVYEPVRLELLAATYRQVEQGPWWPIGKWLFLSSGGRLVNLKGQDKQRHPLPAPAQRIQDDVVLVERVLGIWRALQAQASDAYPCPIPPFAAVRASNHIDDARALGLSKAEDIVVFALHQLCIHPRLHHVAAVRELINSVVRQQRPLAPALACYSEEQWRRLTESLPTSESHP
ncbi:hypothetical protein HG549_12065 [Pseudomonas sp. SK]|uniref:hypothetical protein n=1 Tax=Pseudomonas sp. SK TaxID=2729423 RepID=UPI0014642080|nr:hypothetical protein [Pseudomonas sp. SK]QJQ20634.1 hypothetical protein HG549_12065 [Pseudomonas sp. SK]